jgi:two-component system, sensor histidine kinase
MRKQSAVSAISRRIGIHSRGRALLWQLAHLLREFPHSIQGLMRDAAVVALPYRAGTDADPANRARILCLSYDTELRRGVQSVLEKQWTVTSAADSAGALAVARDVRPDLILADLPPANCDTLLRALRDDPSTSGAPVLMFTRSESDELRVGADDYLAKPFVTWELVARVRLHLELRRLRAGLVNGHARPAVLREHLNPKASAVSENERRRARLLAILVEELRYPLSPIFLALDILKKRIDRRDEEIAIIDRQAHKLSQLVNDVIELERLTFGEVGVQSKRVDVASAVRRAVDATRAAIARGQHRLTVDLPDQPVYVAGDPLRVCHVLVKLLDNAARYTDSGRILLSVKVSEGSVTISVKDDGHGMAADCLERLFEPFDRAPRDQGDRRGPGLGLAIVKTLVDLLGGSAEARSDGLGKGSEFVITLPAAI